MIPRPRFFFSTKTQKKKKIENRKKNQNEDEWALRDSVGTIIIDIGGVQPRSRSNYLRKTEHQQSTESASFR